MEDDYDAYEKMLSIKQVTCNKCNYEFQTQKENKDIRCPRCKSNESFSIR